MQELSAIFFSCRRLDLLHESVKSFLEVNTYPFTDFIIVNDSGDPKIWERLEKEYAGATFVFNSVNEGLIKSIDNGYKEIKTPYVFHVEDDWKVTKDFMSQAMTILENCPAIEEVWLADYNNHPLDTELLDCAGVKYRLASEDYQKGQNGFNDFAWHGFTTACALKRLNDYKRVAPYASIPWQGTIWHREQAIGERYHQLGYRTACLMGEYAVNIGYGKSEYVTGNEK